MFDELNKVNTPMIKCPNEEREHYQLPETPIVFFPSWVLPRVTNILTINIIDFLSAFEIYRSRIFSVSSTCLSDSSIILLYIGDHSFSLLCGHDMNIPGQLIFNQWISSLKGSSKVHCGLPRPSLIATWIPTRELSSPSMTCPGYWDIAVEFFVI